ITNEHVLSKSKTYESVTATFFYEGEQSEQIVISLLDEKEKTLDIIHSSPRRLPDFDPCTKDALDFTIIRFPTGWHKNLKKAYKICSLSLKAKELFKPPPKGETVEQICKRHESWKVSCANIIQHPQGKFKHIAFR